MSGIVSKLKQLNKSKVFLPSIKEEKDIDRININFQSRLQQQLKDNDSEFGVAVKYLLHINDTLQKQLPGVSLTYIDKLSVLYTWSSKKEKVDFTNLPELDGNTSMIDFGEAKVEFKYKNPTLDYENTLLKEIVKKPTITEYDFIFFDTFRFIKSMSFEDDIVYNVKDLSVKELHEIYSNLTLPSIKNINESISGNLKDIETIRAIEGDLSFYTDL
jgi:hypothetical protein